MESGNTQILTTAYIRSKRWQGTLNLQPPAPNANSLLRRRDAVMDGTLLSLISFTCTIKHCIRIANNTASMAICHVSFFPKAIYGKPSK